MRTVLSRSQEKGKLQASWFIICYKLVFGLAEFVSGLVILLFSRQILAVYTIQLAQELSEDPHDLLAQLSEKVVPGALTHNAFLAIYLLLLGAVKIAGAIGLMHRQNWGVDLLVGLTIILFPFQVISFLLHPSLFNFLYIATGILIALYLTEFKPKAWVSRSLVRLYRYIKR